MLLVDSLAEEQIQAALRRGEFDGLPGQGKPLRVDDDSGVPEALRVAYRVLKNSGCLPPELTLRKEVRAVESLLHQVEAGDEQEGVRRRLGWLKARLALQGREVNLLLQHGAYRDKLVHRLARG